MIPQIYFYRVRSYFLGDIVATWDWFKRKNPDLQNLSPMEMLKGGQEKKLVSHINRALKGERRL